MGSEYKDNILTLKNMQNFIIKKAYNNAYKIYGFKGTKPYGLNLMRILKKTHLNVCVF